MNTHSKSTLIPLMVVVALVGVAVVGGIALFASFDPPPRSGEARCYSLDQNEPREVYSGRFSNIRWNSENLVRITDEQGRETVISNAQCTVAYD